MRRMPESVFLTSLIITLILTACGKVHTAVSLFVPDGYPTIQSAIDAAKPGDSIIVGAGTYYENLRLDKAANLMAASYDPADPTRNITIIDAGAANLAPAISIPAGISPMPTVRGFVIRNGSDCVDIHSEAVIEYNYFVSAGDQFDFDAGGGGIVSHNVFYASGDDHIDLDNMTRDLLIEDNRMMYSGDDGIEMRLQDSSAPARSITIIIRNNVIIGSGEDGVQIIDYAQPLDTNRRVVITGNIIGNCRLAGIGLMPNENTVEDYSGADILEAARVYNNTLFGNDYGISGGDNLVAFNNIIAASKTKGVWGVEGPAGANSVVAYTLFHDNRLDSDQSTLGAGNLFGRDPLFLFPPQPGPDGSWGTVDDDFSGLILTSGSPAIDGGVAQYVSHNGEVIPPNPITGFMGLSPDLGWKEFDPLQPPIPTAIATPTAAPTPN